MAVSSSEDRLDLDESGDEKPAEDQSAHGQRGCQSSFARLNLVSHGIREVFRSETASRKNCYAFSYISMAVFTGFLQHVTYTCDISLYVFSARFLLLACYQSVSFYYGNERKD